MPYLTTQQKLQGDPGFFGSLGGILGKVAGFIPGPIGTIAGVLGGAGGGGGRKPSGSIPSFMPGGSPLGPMGGPRAGPAAGMGRSIKKRRRMDPLNVKALRRSTRRLAAFQKEAKKVEAELRKIAPKTRTRARRDQGPGHTHVR